MALGVQESAGLLNQGASEEKGEIARLASFVGAMAISDLVKSTLGPKGMDKILQSMARGLQRPPALRSPDPESPPQRGRELHSSIRRTLAARRAESRDPRFYNRIYFINLFSIGARRAG